MNFGTVGQGFTMIWGILKLYLIFKRISGLFKCKAMEMKMTKMLRLKRMKEEDEYDDFLGFGYFFFQKPLNLGRSLMEDQHCKRR